jgi:catechol 2,3-dioxygenase-like lactoylglutathione lyase family enzyme
MKRFHVHVAVGDLNESVRFYSKVFGAEPTVLKPDYAKWMVEDPRINFAISARGARTGVNHLGLQVDTDEELHALRDQLAAADAGLVEEMGVNCCYAKSDKYWVTDPQGIAWETYHSLGAVPMFDGAAAGDASRATASGCCAPATGEVPAIGGEQRVASGGCCAPEVGERPATGDEKRATASACCGPAAAEASASAKARSCC